MLDKIIKHKIILIFTIILVFIFLYIFYIRITTIGGLHSSSIEKKLRICNLTLAHLDGNTISKEYEEYASFINGKKLSNKENLKICHQFLKPIEDKLPVYFERLPDMPYDTGPLSQSIVLDNGDVLILFANEV